MLQDKAVTASWRDGKQMPGNAIERLETVIDCFVLGKATLSQAAEFEDVQRSQEPSSKCKVQSKGLVISSQLTIRAAVPRVSLSCDSSNANGLG